MNRVKINNRVAFRLGLLATVVMVLAALLVAPASADFGIQAFDGQLAASAEGGAYTQAGGHPYEISTEIELNHHVSTDPSDDPYKELGGEGLVPDGTVKDIVASLPPGLIGNPGGIPKCTAAELGGGGPPSITTTSTQPTCPVASQIGVTTIHTNMDNPFSVLWSGTFPIYAMVPPPGVPASFGFQVEGNLIRLNAVLRSDGDYGLSIVGTNIPESLLLWSTTVTFWGVPADPSHDPQRCDFGTLGFVHVCGDSHTEIGPQPAGIAPRAFLTLPTACTAPGVGLRTDLSIDSWENPGVFAEASYVTHEPPNFPTPPGGRGAQVGVTGCDNVPFDPSFHVTPTSSTPDSPSGLDVSMSFPTDGLENPVGITQSELKSVVVQLPEGVAVNPSAADGLGVCSSVQIALHSKGDPSCPASSKIGTVEIETPLLEAPMEGAVYLAAQGDNPFGSLLAAYLVAKGPGVVVKFPGKIDADPVTGRLTATFDDLPQLPIAKTTLTFKGGPRAPLATPAACGTSQVSSVLGGWSGKSVGLTNPYSVDCTPGLGGFSPGFSAGTTNNQAGAYSPFTLSFSRQDGEQNLRGLTATFPQGVIGKLAGIPLCPDAQANAGTCSDASRIGTVTATAGAGPNPYAVQGKIFLTGSYSGGPFGEVVVVPAIAGPFNLGNVVVRGSIRIDPNTAQATVVSDPFPTILQGIPLRTRTVSVTLDRPGFMFNPTNCEPLTINGSISSAQGSTANVSSRFQAANCAALGFHPSFKVSTKATTSKKNGAFLDVKVTPGAGQANLGKVAVSLPKQLPSRLTTIQQACTKAAFDQNPASCPAGSNIGTATATTPVLANPVMGPVYLVSHGGAAFPDLVMVLQGEGVTAMVTGSINIKGGVTSSAFNSVPDLPISTFDLNLPQGPHSALGSNLPAKAKGNLCGQSLVMPTTLTGQNNAQVKQNTKITVTGCPKAKKAKKPIRGAHGKKQARAKKGSARKG